MDVFKDLVTCQLCSNRMNDPRCLPCLHAFCLKCLVSVSKSAFYSSSNKRYSSPAGRGANFHGLDDDALSAGGAGGFGTSSFGLGGSGSFHCPTCKREFTKLVMEDLPQDFKIVQIIEKMQQRELKESMSCFEHKKKLELFCYRANCLTPICYKCSITSHQNHEVSEITDYYKTLRNRLLEAERLSQQTLENFNHYKNSEVRLTTLGSKLKQLVDNKVKSMILDEKFKSVPSDAEHSPENGIVRVLNRLQIRLLDIKALISTEATNNFASCSPLQMREMHDSVASIIADLNHECYNAQTSMKEKQFASIDLYSFSQVVKDLLLNGKCTEYFDLGLSMSSSCTMTGDAVATNEDNMMLPSHQKIPLPIPMPCAIDASSPRSLSRKSLDSDNSYGVGVGTEGGFSGDDTTAFTVASLDDTNSNCSSKDSPIRKPLPSNPNSSQPAYSEVRNNAQVILRFQVVNPTLDRFTDIRDCALLGDDFVVIDKRNEWLKSFDVSVGRYVGTNTKGFVRSPVGVHTLTNNTMLLVEENEQNFCELFFVDKDLSDKSPFRPDLPVNERIHDVCTSPTGQIILSTKSMNVYEQHAITSEFGTRMSKWRETRFNLLFNANFMISHMAVSATGFIALGNSEDNLIYLYDRNGRHKWKFPVRENTSFKRLKQINFDLAGNLITVDNYYQQVQVISRQGKLIRVLHGRALQFARPICAVPRGDNQIVVMSEFGSVGIIEKYL